MRSRALARMSCLFLKNVLTRTLRNLINLIKLTIKTKVTDRMKRAEVHTRLGYLRKPDALELRRQLNT